MFQFKKETSLTVHCWGFLTTTQHRINSVLWIRETSWHTVQLFHYLCEKIGFPTIPMTFSYKHNPYNKIPVLVTFLQHSYRLNLPWCTIMAQHSTHMYAEYHHTHSWRVLTFCEWSMLHLAFSPPLPTKQYYVTGLLCIHALPLHTNIQHGQQQTVRVMDKWACVELQHCWVPLNHNSKISELFIFQSFRRAYPINPLNTELNPICQ